MDLRALLSELFERIDDAARESADSHKTAMNSYGAGWDAGFVAALREIRDLIDDEER